MTKTTVLQTVISWVGKFGSNPDYVAQVAHALAGYAVTMTTAYFFRDPWIGALSIVFLWGIPKEFYLDIRYEHASYLDGLKDWSFYALGTGLALLISR